VVEYGTVSGLSSSRWRGGTSVVCGIEAMSVTMDDGRTSDRGLIHAKFGNRCLFGMIATENATAFASAKVFRRMPSSPWLFLRGDRQRIPR
jgi:hypothetical protein